MREDNDRQTERAAKIDARIERFRDETKHLSRQELFERAARRVMRDHAETFRRLAAAEREP